MARARGVSPNGRGCPHTHKIPGNCDQPERVKPQDSSRRVCEFLAIGFNKLSSTSWHRIDNMPIPFGVGVGDFIAVGKLIKQIVVELQDVSFHVNHEENY